MKKMAKMVLLKLLLLCAAFTISRAQQKANLISYVNPLTGTTNSTTKSATKHGAGTEPLANTIPAVGLPFGMTQWTPQTRLTEQKCVAPYYFNDKTINGFRGTHWISGSCMQDYGSVTIMPTTGRLKTLPAQYQTTLNHKNEKATPAYYYLKLDDYNLVAEITATQRCSMMQFTLLQNDTLNILITPNSDKAKGFIKFDKGSTQISGYNPAHRIYQGLGEPAGFSGYFAIRFQKAYQQHGVYGNYNLLQEDSIINRENIGAFIRYKVSKGDVVKIKIGTSFSSIAEAENNLDAEMPGWDFNGIKNKGAAAWQNELHKMEVNGGSEKNKRIFYTALYHSLQHPRLFSDASGSYPKFSQSYQLATIQQSQYFDDFSQWDIYRAQLPLLEIINPPIINSFVQSMIVKGQQGGWLPIFPCWNNYTSAMVGDHVIPFIASAYHKGICNYDINEAYRLMRQNAFDTPVNNKDYRDGKGRRALTSYIKYSYVPLEDTVPHAFHKKEQTSRTLEYAYDDYALATVAKALGKTDDFNLLNKRAENYKNVFDAKVGFVNGRYENGDWFKNFDPDKKIASRTERITFITEGTPRQYTFYVPHDVNGLNQLMGGGNALENQLDSLFAKNEYWHGNEPGHHIPFLYNFTNSAYKTQLQVNKILNNEYDEGIGGLSGNDDAGQVSAWYVFAAIGLYPVDPVSGEYALSSPLFNQIRIKVANNKTVNITCKRESKYSIYIKSITLNGKPYQRNFISHKDLVAGAHIEFMLSDKPVSSTINQQ
jgi:predicted alpha-1,2-mannosidase